MASHPWPEDRLQPCGTLAAYKRHQRRGEPVDEACRLANRLARSRNGYPSGKEAGGHGGAARRAVRNGLPEFRPYRYQGLGYDAITGEL